MPLEFYYCHWSTYYHAMAIGKSALQDTSLSIHINAQVKLVDRNVNSTC